MKHLVANFTVGRKAAILAILISWSTACADDQAAYESLSEVTIGRVFFSPEQRALLENRRRRRTTQGPLPGVKTSPARTRSQEAAGYIVNSAGHSKIYSNGDFVTAVVQKKMAFPGDVALVRQKKSSPTSDEEDAIDTESSDADN